MPPNMADVLQDPEIMQNLQVCKSVIFLELVEWGSVSL